AVAFDLVNASEDLPTTIPSYSARFRVSSTRTRISSKVFGFDKTDTVPMRHPGRPVSKVRQPSNDQDDPTMSLVVPHECLCRTVRIAMRHRDTISELFPDNGCA